MQQITNERPNHETSERYVDARFLSKKYRVSSRLILVMAAEGRLPCVRIGKRCVRFSETAVAEVLAQDAQ